MKEVKQKLLEELKKFVEEEPTPLEEIKQNKWVDESKGFLDRSRKQVNEALMKWALKPRKNVKKTDPFDGGDK